MLHSDEDTKRGEYIVSSSLCSMSHFPPQAFGAMRKLSHQSIQDSYEHTYSCSNVFAVFRGVQVYPTGNIVKKRVFSHNSPHLRHMTPKAGR